MRLPVSLMLATETIMRARYGRVPLPFCGLYDLIKYRSDSCDGLSNVIFVVMRKAQTKTIPEVAATGESTPGLESGFVFERLRSERSGIYGLIKTQPEKVAAARLVPLGDSVEMLVQGVIHRLHSAAKRASQFFNVRVKQIELDGLPDNM